MDGQSDMIDKGGGDHDGNRQCGGKCTLPYLTVNKGDKRKTDC